MQDGGSVLAVAAGEVKQRWHRVRPQPLVVSPCCKTFASGWPKKDSLVSLSTESFRSVLVVFVVVVTVVVLLLYYRPPRVRCPLHPHTLARQLTFARRRRRPCRGSLRFLAPSMGEDRSPSSSYGGSARVVRRVARWRRER